MSITIKAGFNKQQKDSKKESVQFYVKGEDEKRPELRELTRSVVIISIEGVEQTLTAEFKKSLKDGKKTVLDFEIKGDASAEKSFEFYKRAGSDVVLTITETNESIEEFEERQKAYREGLKGKIGADGTVEVDPNQQTIDDVMKGIDDAPDTKVTELSSKRQSKAEKEAEKQAAEQKDVAVNAEKPLPFSDDPNDSPL